MTIDEVAVAWENRSTDEDRFAHLLLRWVSDGAQTDFKALDDVQQETLAQLLEVAAKDGMTAETFHRLGTNITFNDNANMRRKVLTDAFNGGTGVRRERRMSDDDFFRRPKPDVTNPLTRGLSRWKDGNPVEYITQRADFTVTDEEGETYDSPETVNAPKIARGDIADVDVIGIAEFKAAIAAGATNAQAAFIADAAETAAIHAGEAEYKYARAVPLLYALTRSLLPELNGVAWGDHYDVDVKDSDLKDSVLLSYLIFTPALTNRQIAEKMSTTVGAVKQRWKRIKDKYQKKNNEKCLAALERDDPALCWRYQRDRRTRELEAKQEALYVQRTSLPAFKPAAADDTGTVCPWPPSAPLPADPDAPYHTWMVSDFAIKGRAEIKELDAMSDLVSNAADIAQLDVSEDSAFYCLAGLMEAEEPRKVFTAGADDNEDDLFV